MSRLRLLLTADAVGGVWQYTTDLAHALAPLDVDALVAVLGPAPSLDQRALAGDLRVIETGLPLDWQCYGPEPVRAAGRAIAKLAEGEAVDLVQLNMPTLAVGDFPVPILAVTHGCVSTWWEGARHDPLSADYLWHRGLMGEGLRRADRVVAPTAAYARTIAVHYDLSPMPIAVHNGRRALHLPTVAMRDFVFTAGRLWDPAKNASVLDGIAARLDVPFVAAGALRGPHGETAHVERLVTRDHVGETEIAAHLAARPVFLSAATFEPFGLAVLEAAAAGCALVLSDIASFRELWEGVATFVQADDDSGFVRAVEAILADPPRRVALGRAAQVRAQRFTPAETASAMMRLYTEMLPQRDGAAAA